MTLDESVAPLEYNYRDKAELEQRTHETYFTSGESHGLSVFFRVNDDIFHSYSTYARGCEGLTDAYSMLDTTPYGRQEDFEDSPPGSRRSQPTAKNSVLNSASERSMFKTIAIVAVVLIVALLIYAATKPDTFRVQRSASIQAPPEKIFPLVNDLHSHATWSPWEKKDPAMKRTHSGATSGKGAVYEWDGNKEIGKGRMEITESTPPSKVVMAMHFIKPFEAHNTAEFILEPRGDSTTVTWVIYGPQPYLAKVMHLFFNMDRMIGTEFEAGLSSLKAITEK